MGRRVDKLGVGGVVDVGAGGFGRELVVVFFQVVPERADVAGVCCAGYLCFVGGVCVSAVAKASCVS